MIVGFRFQPQDRDRLIELVGRAQRLELGVTAVSLFREAAEACTKNQALIVHCEDLEEARLFAAGFTQYGVTAPTLEQTSLEDSTTPLPAA
jgi:hypothetical protein